MKFKPLTIILGLVISGILYLLPDLSKSRNTVQAFSGCEENCEKCHSINTNEVKLILNKIKANDAKILKIKMSPVKGLWEVAVENKGRRGVLYVDFSKKYLVSGSIIEVNAAINKTKERIDELNKNRRINPATVSLKDTLVIGSPSAAKKVIVFTDPD